MIVAGLMTIIGYIWLFLKGYGWYLIAILISLGIFLILGLIMWIGYIMATTPESSIETLVPDQDEKSL